VALCKTQAFGYPAVPTVLRAHGFVVRIHGPPREHGPPHVHVERPDGALLVARLGLSGRPPVVWRVHGMRDADVLRAIRLVTAHDALLRSAWERIHGT
jgi:hypothetical protein